MNTPGIIRNIDELGRLVLPAEFRQALSLQEGDAVELSLAQDGVLVRRHVPACALCGRPENLYAFRGKKVCMHCIRALREDAAFADL